MRLMNQWENQISHPYSQTLTFKISQTKSTHSSTDPKYFPRIKFGLLVLGMVSWYFNLGSCLYILKNYVYKLDSRTCKWLAGDDSCI